MSTIRALKQKLRKSIKFDISQLSSDEIQRQSQEITKRLTNLQEFKHSNAIGLYVNMPTNEIITDELIKISLQMGKKVYLPRITPLVRFNDYKRFETQKNCLHMLKISSLNDLSSELDENTPGGKYKIFEPDFQFSDMDREIPINDLYFGEEELDLIIVPGLAFTSECERLGHGIGFYDDFFKRYADKFQNKPLLVGISLLEQLVHTDKMVIDDHDEILDLVVTCDQIYTKPTTNK